jgi:hypothetical protein
MHHTVVPPAGAHRQIRACTIERQRYSRTVSSRGCSNYVRTYSVHSDVHDDVTFNGASTLDDGTGILNTFTLGATGYVEVLHCVLHGDYTGTF